MELREILSASGPLPPAETVGASREGRPIRAWRIGSGPFRVSLIAGCHADEPVGPLLLRALVRCLGSLPASRPELAEHEWWIVPHLNPDGAERNRPWIERIGETVDPVLWLTHVEREGPGDDVEFGFPRNDDDHGARPENRAVWRWWRGSDRPFRLHASLHGMAVAQGPWFLVEEAWRDRSELLQARCRRATDELGYRLHDVDRRGEKGFTRIGPGFTTRPDSRAMARFFRDEGDEATAALFRPSSMESVRALGGDPLTLVSEMPLFLVPPRPEAGPSTSEDLGRWTTRLADWRAALDRGDEAGEIRARVEAEGLRAMPVRDQMHLQWEMIRSGIEQVRADGS